jgi:7,8-dihydropterin-6-yl-methyl-4-(beta-D-ribofuranosyl)aminobenzene 5'-phosphate synthase
VGPWLAARSYTFGVGRRRAEERNARRIERARPLDLPALSSLEITVVLEHEHDPGFLGAAAASYLIRTERGSVLVDVGHGDARHAFEHNARKLGLTDADIDVLDVLDVRRVHNALVLDQGVASTGPLARMLYFHGMVEEQAVLAHLEGKGLVVLIGPCHPGVESILALARHLSDEPLYAIGGGLNLPVTGSRRSAMGVQTQQLFGTGKPPWDRLDEADLDHAIEVLNRAAPRRLLLSAHNSCDHALDRLHREVEAETEILRAGATYRL